MAKLYFRYGTMGSSKTANALMVQYNYNERGQQAWLVKPDIEKRDGREIIKSRIGLESPCLLFSDFLKKYFLEKRKLINEWLSSFSHEEVDKKYRREGLKEKVSCIIVDEAQFLSKNQVDILADIVDIDKVPIICYGLRTDFQGKLFEGSKRLFELADEIEEIKTVCWCGKAARFSARVRNGGIVTTGEQFLFGANESYVPLCRKHFFDRKLK